MKAILFTVMTTLATGALAADSIYVTTELTRNGEILDSFATVTTNGVTRPFRNVQLIKYRDGGSKNKIKLADLEVGTTGSITPFISGNSISVRSEVNYVELTQMKAEKNGDIYTDQPQTTGFHHSSEEIISNGE